MKNLTPCGAAHLFCTLVCHQTPQEVTKCENRWKPETKEGCPLWSFRLGKNPNRKGQSKDPNKPRNVKTGVFSSSKQGKKLKRELIIKGEKEVKITIEEV